MPRGHVLPDFRSIAHLRGEAGLTQYDVAARSGYGRRTISKIENGKPTTAPTLSAIATVLAQSLGRAITLTDLVRSPQVTTARRDFDEPQSADEGSEASQGPMDFIVGEQILSLHLPSLAMAAGRRLPAAEVHPPGLGDPMNGSSAIPVNGRFRGGSKRSKDFRPHAVLIDTLSLRFADIGLSEVEFSYPSYGQSARCQSLSHPASGRKSGRREMNEACDCCGRGPIVRAMLSHFIDRPLVVQNEIEYHGAFDRLDDQRFYTDVVFPTDSLAVLLHFPPDRRFITLSGGCRRHCSAPLVPVGEQPIALAPGRVAYWRVANPLVGERYELSWE